MSIISQSDMSLGGETGSTSLNNPPVLGQDRPKEPTCRTCSAQRFLSCLMLCWSTAPPFNRVLQSKQMYRVQTYHRYPQAYAQQGSCLDLMIDLEIMRQPWEGWRKIQMLKQKKVELIRNKDESELSKQNDEL